MTSQHRKLSELPRLRTELAEVLDYSSFPRYRSNVSISLLVLEQSCLVELDDLARSWEKRKRRRRKPLGRTREE